MKLFTSDGKTVHACDFCGMSEAAGQKLHKAQTTDAAVCGGCGIQAEALTLGLLADALKASEARHRGEVRNLVRRLVRFEAPAEARKAA